jgi:hypothetical protein
MGRHSVKMHSDIPQRATRQDQIAYQKKGAKMYSNDLNSAYMYESERRKDEMREAAESQRAHELLGGKRKMGMPSPMVIIGILAVLIIVIRAF